MNNIKLNSTEQRIANALSKIIVIILAIFAYLIRLIAKLLWKLKKYIYKLAILILVTNSVLGALTNVVYAPKPVYAIYAQPKTEREQIINYIIERFGDQADNAMKVLSCENHSLNPKARGMNTNGTSDVGIFQINGVHGVPETYLKDWHTNIDIAYQIYKASGWQAWACVTVYHALDK